MNQMLNIILKLPTKKQIDCVSLMWEWWKHRNKINAENVKLDVASVVHNARRNALEYAQFCVPAPKRTMQTQKIYKPPDGDCLKVKIDGSFYASSSMGGWGFVLRDSKSRVLGAAAGRIEWLVMPYIHKRLPVWKPCTLWWAGVFITSWLN